MGNYLPLPQQAPSIKDEDVDTHFPDDDELHAAHAAEIAQLKAQLAAMHESSVKLIAQKQIVQEEDENHQLIAAQQELSDVMQLLDKSVEQTLEIERLQEELARAEEIAQEALAEKDREIADLRERYCS